MSWPLGFPVPSMPTEALWGSPDAPWGSGTDGLGFESQTDPPVMDREVHGPGPLQLSAFWFSQLWFYHL